MIATVHFFLYLLIAFFVVYALLPNILTRIFGFLCMGNGPADKRQIALTFDDGPDPDYTGRLLDTLRECNTHATFFVLAVKALEFPDLIERMMNEGHEVAVHGMTHRFMPLSTIRQTSLATTGAASALHKRFGIHANYYRPTWGLCNLSTFLTIRAMKLKFVTWSVMVSDWRVTDAHTLLERIIRKLQPGGIIVLHDSDKTPGAEHGAPEGVIQLLPKMVEAAQLQGLHFVPMSEWIGGDV